ncbi:MAG TPA: transglycosylase domain-containing protein [Phnomibacter sp.]|nr:transglycosylase domain-containing protein [Phnomibacter sp.]
MKKVLKKILRVFFWLFAFHLAYTLLIWVVNPPITITMIGSLVRGDGLKRDNVPLKKMSTPARLSVIAAEDQLFATHNGFDMKAIEKAMEYNEKKKGKKIRGGSTISQQVAKNVFLR